MSRLRSALPHRSEADVDRAVQAREYWAQLSASPWVTDDVLLAATDDLIRTVTWFPPVADILRACQAAEHEIDLRAARAATEADTGAGALPDWLRGGEGPRGLDECVARGEWDRVAAAARVTGRMRRESRDRHAARIEAEWGRKGRRRDRTGALVVAGNLVAAEAWPVPTRAAVDAEIDAMQAAGALRGPVEAALAWDAPGDAA